MKDGKRIRFFRTRRGMTQQELGECAGFPPASAGTRVAQYETGERNPKQGLRKRFADLLGVSVDALAIPDLDTPAGAMHTLFAMEDLYGFQISETEEGPVLRLPASPDSGGMQEPLTAWARFRAAMDAGLLSKEEYDQWRWRFAADG